VDDGVDLGSPDLVVQPLAIQEIAFDESRVWMDSRSMSVSQAVESDDAVPLLQKPFGYDAADISGRAGHKDVHALGIRPSVIATDVPVV
jgi:hypothetical protein